MAVVAALDHALSGRARVRQCERVVRVLAQSTHTLRGIRISAEDPVRRRERPDSAALLGTKPRGCRFLLGRSSSYV